jgi:small subunit ribosomal protein S16
MAVVIRLMRAGAKKRPSYRLVAADSRRQRDGRFLQILGHYDPIPKTEKGYELLVHQDLVQKWLDQGAQPSEQVASLLRAAGMTLGRPSKPTKKAVAEGAAPKPRTRRKPRKVTERKLKARTTRAAGPKKPAAKKTAK